MKLVQYKITRTTSLISRGIISRRQTFFNSIIRFHPIHNISYRRFCTPGQPLKYPVGTSDFKTIVSEKFFFWDKTLFIQDFFQDSQFVLLLRPRRFSKTTIATMLGAFCDITNKEQAKEMFIGTKIAKIPQFMEQHLAKYPAPGTSMVIMVLLNVFRTMQKLRQTIALLYQRHEYMLKTTNSGTPFLSLRDQELFAKTLKEDPSVLYEASLTRLTEWLHKYHGSKVIVIIDEYDAPIMQALELGYYEQSMKFFGPFLSDALKDNPAVGRALLTGVLRVAKSGYLSGLNNLTVRSLLHPRYGDKLGVTEEELRQSLIQIGEEHNLEALRRYYDGYVTELKGVNLCNTWSVLNFLQNRRIEPYWHETGSTFLLGKLLWEADAEIQQIMYKLAHREHVTVAIQLDLQVTNLNNTNAIINLLYLSGYLTGRILPPSENLPDDSPRKMEVWIPNVETALAFQDIIRSYLDGKPHKYISNAVQALLKNDVQSFRKYLTDIIHILVSVQNTSLHQPENFWHGLTLGMLACLWEADYQIESEPEVGFGYADIRIIPPEKLVNRDPIVLEFKSLKPEDHSPEQPKKRGRGRRKKESLEDIEAKLEAKATEALQQIQKKKYFVDLSQKYRGVQLYGIAVCGKQCEVKHQRIAFPPKA